MQFVSLIPTGSLCFGPGTSIEEFKAMATINVLHVGAAFPRLARPGVLARVAQAWSNWRQTHRAAAAGQYLVELDDHMLQDLGISRAQAAFMASRPLLRARWNDR
jgi:uncharacterized protein YjiS (DUF1127 family)